MELAHLGSSAAARERERDSLLQCNRFTGGFGLVLSEGEVLALMQKRDRALRETGRMEFGASILPKLVLAFRDSPYLVPGAYAEMLGELTEAFYQCKNECMDALSDDVLLDAMRTAFDGPCGGSPEELGGFLDAAARNLRAGRPMHWAEPGEREEEDDGDDRL